MTKVLAGLILAVTLFLTGASTASAENRSLKLYFTHTRERAEITYKRNGRFIQGGLDQVNHMLRDWRRNEPTKMDPRLLDLLWEVYRQSGSRDYIHIVSAYRSPATNSMLRSRSSGVAEKSQHMLGKAIDFFLPDVKLSKLRAIGLKMQVGGVGYYPRSGSPFVHLDVGGVRHWPRMSRTELAAIFPDGKTLHVPSDGKPMPGYQQAMAAYQSRQRSGGAIQVANDSGSGNRGRGLLATLFGGGADEEEDNANVQVAAVPQRAPQAVQQQQPSVQALLPEAQSEPETPAAILAALPPRALPVPQAAPRPAMAVGAPQQAEAEPPLPGSATPPAAAALMAAMNVPLPSPRPDYKVPVIQPSEAQTASASSLPMTAFVTPSQRPQSPSKDVIAELLADQLATEKPDTGQMLAMASAKPDEVSSVLQDVKGEAERQPAPAAVKAVAGANPVKDSPRLAMLKATGGLSPAAIVSSAKTTPKAARPGPQDAGPEPKPVVQPVNAQKAALVLSRESVLNKTERAKAPSFNAQIAVAPKAVYTDGFKVGAVVADSRRFSGKAVNFLSVARFE